MFTVRFGSAQFNGGSSKSSFRQEVMLSATTANRSKESNCFFNRMKDIMWIVEIFLVED